MARVFFTANLRRHVDCTSMDADGERPCARCWHASSRRRTGSAPMCSTTRARSRKHMTILVDGQRIRDLERLSDAVGPSSEVWVMQALSGG